jgi:hypothetical protein
MSFATSGNGQNNGTISVQTNGITSNSGGQVIAEGYITGLPDSFAGTNHRAYFEYGISSSNLYQTTSKGTGFNGTFQGVMSGLSRSVKYYYRAALQLENGTMYYGTTKEFVTN